MKKEGKEKKVEKNGKRENGIVEPSVRWPLSNLFQTYNKNKKSPSKIMLWAGLHKYAEQKISHYINQSFKIELEGQCNDLNLDFNKNYFE